MAMMKKEEKKEFMFKMVMIGDAATGKTSILRRYCNNVYEESYKCTTIEFQIKVLPLPNGKLVKLQIWDTAGQERFVAMTQAYFRGTKAAMIVYDITRRDTFEHVKVWAESYFQRNDVAIECRLTQALTIMANKKDLEDKRAVSYEEGKQLATSLNAQFFEVSAKLESNEISDIFANIATALVDYQEKHDTTQTDNVFGQGRMSLRNPKTIPEKDPKKGRCCK